MQCQCTQINVVLTRLFLGVYLSIYKYISFWSLSYLIQCFIKDYYILPSPRRFTLSLTVLLGFRDSSGSPLKSNTELSLRSSSSVEFAVEMCFRSICHFVCS